MGRHLNQESWMRRNAAGKWQLKRVSAELEKRFPRDLRVIWRDAGATALVKAIMQRESLGLAAAWERVKTMVNGEDQVSTARPDDEIIPGRDGQRMSLNPDEVERLEELGYRVKVNSIASMHNGRRWCTVSKAAT